MHPLGRPANDETNEMSLLNSSACAKNRADNHCKTETGTSLLPHAAGVAMCNDPPQLGRAMRKGRTLTNMSDPVPGTADMAKLATVRKTPF